MFDARNDERPPRARAVPLVRGRALLERRWDAIVIGAGVGGLASAVLLATRGRLRVLVLERHYEPGGLAQTFRRRRDAFEVGVHYVGEVHGASSLRRVFDELTERRLAWSPLGAVHDRVWFERERVDFGDDVTRTRDALVRFAPTEAHVIDRYLDDVRTCARAAPLFLLGRAERRTVESERAPFRRFVDRTTSEHLAALGASPRLAALLTYCAGNYACSPDRSSFAAHAIAFGYYLDGASVPVGGGARIATELIETLARHGGAVIVRAEVSAIRVHDGRVRGVRLADGRELDAPIVVSDAGLHTTAHRLLDESAPGVGAMREACRAIGPSLASCALYLGLAATPRELGLVGPNHWQLDVEPRRAEGAMAAWVRGDASTPPAFCVSSPCAHDPSWSERHPGRASAVALFNAPWAPFAEWRDLKRGQRGAAYDALKDRLTREALDAVLRALPRLRGAVDHVELSTPVTTRTFTGHAHGEMAGLDHTPLRFRLACTPKTEIRGLALAGQDAWLAGIGGAVMGGVSAASYVLERNLAREILLRS